METGVFLVSQLWAKTCAANSQQSLSSSISQSAVTLRRVAAFCFARSRLFELAHVLVRLDYVARVIVNANHSTM